jgi:hypothetical protein
MAVAPDSPESNQMSAHHALVTQAPEASVKLQTAN